jgi:ferredoxin-type protein NapG
MPWTRRDFLAGVGVVAGAALGLLFRRRVGEVGPVLLRPPGAQPDRGFLAACIRCEQCVEACPWDALRIAGVEAGLGLGTPYVISREVPCYVCEGYEELRCVSACPTDALLPVSDRTAIHMGTAVINEENCIAYAGAVCRACWHACPIEGAILFDWENRPVVDEQACIGCGLCDHACPTEPSSIPIRPVGASAPPPCPLPGMEGVA